MSDMLLIFIDIRFEHRLVRLSLWHRARCEIFGLGQRRPIQVRWPRLLIYLAEIRLEFDPCYVRRSILYNLLNSTPGDRALVIETSAIHTPLRLFYMLAEFRSAHVLTPQALQRIQVPNEPPDLVHLGLDVLGRQVVLVSDGHLLKVLQVQHTDTVVPDLFY